MKKKKKITKETYLEFQSLNMDWEALLSIHQYFKNLLLLQFLHQILLLVK